MRERKFEMWQLLLLGIFFALFLVIVAALVEHAVSDKYRSGPLSKAAYAFSRIPADTKDVVKFILGQDRPQLTPLQRFKGERGFKLYDDGGARDGDLLVVTRFDEKRGRSLIEFINPATGDTVHEYLPAYKDMLKVIRDAYASDEKSAPWPQSLEQDLTPDRFMPTHPIIEDDGSVVFHGMDSPLMKMNACGEILWATPGIYHHAIEKDADGNYWTSARMQPSTVKYTAPDFADDAIAKISSDGELLFIKSVAQILIENDLAHVVYTADVYLEDPIHLNDVQPALEDGPYWKRGDVFLSLRNQSTILQYRPSTNKVIWLKRGPWIAQHDVDFLNDREISVFDNHSAVWPGGELVIGQNDVPIYNFATDDVRSEYAAGFEKNKIRTTTDGLQRILPNGDLFVEEQNYGRLLTMSKAGDLRWTYVNRGDDNRVYYVQWGRYLTASEAAAPKAALAASSCPAT